jgi:hypothetical protein
MREHAFHVCASAPAKKHLAQKKFSGEIDHDVPTAQPLQPDGQGMRERRQGAVAIVQREQAGDAQAGRLG